MTRRAQTFDRLAVLFAGLLLLAGGAGAIWWTFGPRAGDAITLGPAVTTVDEAWWPWASGAVGLLLIGTALRWLATHHRPARAQAVTLGAGMTADVAPVAHAAAAVLGALPGVVSASSRAVSERGTPTILLTATVDARPGLSAAASAADEVAGTVAEMFGDAVAVRTRIRVDARRRRTVR